MPLDPRKRQKALARRAAKASQRKVEQRREHQAEIDFARGGRAAVRAAASWPVYHVLISSGWETPGALAELLVTRRSPEGRIMAAVFLVDLACLGVKSAFARGYQTAGELDDEIRDRMFLHSPPVSIQLDLAAKILREAVAYARTFGFGPDPDFETAVLLLAGAAPDACPARIPLGGTDGRPLYISGPNDNPRRVIDKLMKKLGPGGFEYFIGVDDHDSLEELETLPGASVVSAADLEVEEEE